MSIKVIHGVDLNQSSTRINISRAFESGGVKQNDDGLSGGSYVRLGGIAVPVENHRAFTLVELTAHENVLGRNLDIVPYAVSALVLTRMEEEQMLDLDHGTVQLGHDDFDQLLMGFPLVISEPDTPIKFPQVELSMGGEDEAMLRISEVAGIGAYVSSEFEITASGLLAASTFQTAY